MDTDGDGIPDYLDTDSDNDGIPDGVDAHPLEPAAIVCAALGDATPAARLDRDTFTFRVHSGDVLHVALEAAAGSNATGRATLEVRGPATPRVARSAATLPTSVTSAATKEGQFKVTVGEQPRKKPGTAFHGPYCIAVELYWLLLASAEESLGNPPRTRLERRGAIVHIALVLDALVHRFRDVARRAAERLAAAVRTGTRPSPGPVISGFLRDVARSRRELIAENMLLRQQLVVAARRVKKPRFAARERGLLVALAHFVPQWRDAVLLVRPETILRWHRAGFRLFWRGKSRLRARGMPKRRTPPETVELIRRLANENTLWGAERIRGELLKLGIHVAKRTVQKYMRQVRGPRPWGQSWSTFLENHLHQIWACDFLQLYDIWFRPIFAFFIVELGSRKVVHVGVTRSPSATWVAQRLRNATPFATGPRFIIRDNDDKFGPDFERAAKAAGGRVLRTAVKAPRMNSFCERFLGSVRRECLDHVVVLGEAHLHRVLGEYCFAYFNRARSHQGIGQLVPIGSSSAGAGSGPVTGRAVLNGLHHDYRRAA